jgi:1,6-anhydro-N-acetylmuramate kinase
MVEQRMLTDPLSGGGLPCSLSGWELRWWWPGATVDTTSEEEFDCDIAEAQNEGLIATANANVCAGLLRSDHAKEQALLGFTSESPTSGKKLAELGSKKERLG